MHRLRAGQLLYPARVHTKYTMHNNTQTVSTNWLINSAAHRPWYRFMSCSLEVCLLQSKYSDDPRDKPIVTNIILGSCTTAHWVSKNDKDIATVNAFNLSKQWHNLIHVEKQKSTTMFNS